MKKIILIATCAAAVSAYALPTYEPFTEFSASIASNGTNMTAQTNSNKGSLGTNANGMVSNCLDLATGGYSAPGGELWTSLAFSGTGGNGAYDGLDIALINNSNIFTTAYLGNILPTTFPGFPSGTNGGITTIVENPAQPWIWNGSNAYAANPNIVGNSAVLKFASDITRPTTGTKTVYVSYLLSIQQLGQLGTGNDGRYFAFLPSTNLVEGSNTSGFYKTWTPMFSTFGVTGEDQLAGHGLLEQSGSSAYIGACDWSAGKDFTTSSFQVPLGVTGGASGNPVFVVGAYLFNASGKDTNILWMNPSVGSFGGATPPASPIQAVTMAYNMSDIGGFCLMDRIGSGAAGGVGTNYVANLLVGSTWSYVTGGPEFTVQPANMNSNNVTLTATAIAAGQTVSYQWQRVTATTTNNLVDGAGGAGGSATVSGSATATVTLTGMTPADAGSYQVVATASSTGYQLTSSTAAVAPDPLITAQPQNTASAIGGSAMFNIGATTQYGSLTYRWIMNGTALANGTRGDGSVISGATSAALTIANVQSDEGGAVITCGVTNGVAIGTISTSATLTLIDPAISTQPVSLTTNYGATATFTAVAQTTAAHAPLRYAWYNVNSGVMIADGLQSDGSTASGATGNGSGTTLTTTLTLSNVSYQDNSSYALYVTNSVGSVASSVPVTLFVNDPVITAQPPSVVEVALGGNTTITVGAGGSDVSYQWNSVSTGQVGGGDFSGTQTSALTISGAQATDAGTYYLTISGVSNTLTSSNVVVYVDTAVTSVSLSPAALTQQTGTHLAMVGTVSGGAGGLVDYIWTRNGVALANGTQADGSGISGVGTNILVLTNIQAGDSGTYTLTVSNAAGKMSATSTLAVTNGLLPLSTNNLVVSRVGEGSEALSGATGNTMYLDQFTTNGGYVSSIMIPDSGTAAVIVPGAGSDWQNESFITLSSNQSYLNLTGYGLSYPAFGTDVTAPVTGYSRGIGAVNGYGYYSLAYTNLGLYNGGAHFIRDVCSTDGLTNFWTTGAAGSVAGLKYVQAGSGGAAYAGGVGVPTIGQWTNNGGPLNGPSCIGFAGTNLVITDNNTTDTNVLSNGSAAYLADGLDIFAGVPEVGGASSNVMYFGNAADFAFSPDLNTVYVADTGVIVAGGTGYGGGVQRWDLIGGVYTYQYNLEDTTVANATNGVRGIAAYFPAGTTMWGRGVLGAVVYATTSEMMTNRLIQFVDNGVNSSATLLATAGPNQFLRGVRFGPAIVPLSFVTEPVSQSAVIGQEVDLTAAAAGTSYSNAPFSYQWYVDGVAITGATNAVLNITNVQSSNAASYKVSVSSGAGSPLVSTNAVLTVSPFTLTSGLVGWWKLSDGSGTTAADSSGYNDSGSLTNFPGDNSEWITGLGGNDALNYANVDTNNDNAVVVPDAPQLNFSNNLAFTLASWIMSTQINSTNATGGAIIAKGYGNGGEQYVLDLYSNCYRFYVRNASGSATVLQSTNQPVLSAWQHVAATCDGYGQAMALYVNGQMVTNNQVAPPSLLASSWPVSIGNRTSSLTNAYDYNFIGEIQDARIYDIALGASDIQAIYQYLAPLPQMHVFNGAAVITNGQTTPAVSFGSVSQGATAPVITFMVTNSGSAALTLGTPTVPSGYSVVTNLPATIAVGASGTFSVQLSTTATGTFAGNVSIANSSASNPFTFAVTGTVITAVPPSFAAIPISGAPGAPVLHMSGSVGGTYRVWSTTNLALKPVTTQWTLVGTGVFTGGADTFACPAGGPAAQYYTITQP
jgi:hypothetical protein